MTDDDPEAMTVGQHVTLLAQMVLGVIPVVGPVLERSLFGVLQSRRENRVLGTIQEISERLGKTRRTIDVESERFQALLEASLPLIAAATNDQKRQVFRNLLLNAATAGTNDDAADEAELALRLIMEIDPPGLAMIAAFGRLASDMIIVRNGSPPFAFAANFGDDKDKEVPAGAERHELPYAFSVLDEWRRRFGSPGTALFSISGATDKGSFSLYGSARARLIVRWGYWSEQ